MRPPLRAFLGDKTGGVLILAPVALLAAAGTTALGIDAANLYYSKLKLQHIADNAALGSVLALPTSSMVTIKALSLAAANTPQSFGTVAQTGDVQLGTYDASTQAFAVSSSNQNAVKVTTHRAIAYGNPVITYFGALLGVRQVEVSASSIAVKYGGACVMVLDPKGTNALQTKGSAQIQANCPLQVNSSANTAASTGGSSSITASMTCIVGGYNGSGWSPLPKTGCPALADPLAGVPEPTAPPLCGNNPSFSSQAVPANCTYSGTVNLTGNITLQPGLYYFQNASITISGSTNISGNGVTIFLDRASSLNLGGSGTIALSAAASGPQMGILIFQSRLAPSSTSLSIGGTGVMSLNGTLYAPSATLNLSGNATYSAASKYGYAIGYDVAVGGSGAFVFKAFPSTAVNPRNLKAHASRVR
ncbi:TadG family pilus assembly protein [Methylobacterium sp. P31]